MQYYLRVVAIFFIFMIVNSGCKSLKKIEDHSGQLRYSDEANKAAVNISNLIDTKELTLICVRHAEKQSDSKNPSLTDEGKQRAKDLSMLLAKVEIEAIYSSDYNRTIETAQALSNRTKLPIQRYNPRQLDEFKNTILSNYQNGIVVIVGHSNSTPKFVNALLSENKYAIFDESDYDNIFVASIDASRAVDVHLLEFGVASSTVAH